MKSKPGYINPRVFRLSNLKHKKEKEGLNKVIDNLNKIIEKRDKEIIRLKGTLSDYGL